MAFDPKAILQKAHSFLSASNRFPGGVTIGEPKAPPGDWAAAVILGPIQVTEVSLGTASGVITIVVRTYQNALVEPIGDREWTLGRLIFELLEDFCGDFDFGDTSVRNLVPLGVSATPGYQEIGGILFRVSDIALPLMVNDFATFTQ